MTFSTFEEIEDYVSELVQKELGYETDLIAQENWNIMEEDVPQKVMEVLRDQFEESDLEEEVDQDYVEELFQSTLKELEPEEGYRISELWQEESYEDDYGDGDY